jgi:hypothetical protein
MEPKGARHLLWIPAGTAAGFIAAFVFGDLLRLPVDLYYLIYFSVVAVFLWLYARSTNLDLKDWLSHRLIPGVILGVAVGVVMLSNVLSRPVTARLQGGPLAWAIFWRGLVYGAVDGLLLYTLPWMVTWRAFAVRGKSLGRRIGFGFLAWAFVLVITTGYHLGYADFRTRKILQPNIGSTIMMIPTVFSGNPVGSPITHMFLHVTAVVHSPESELFLPPHREVEE